ncbi:9834_t:CDS:1, partial [Cetraspora pellucida]
MSTYKVNVVASKLLLHLVNHQIQHHGAIRNFRKWARAMHSSRSKSCGLALVYSSDPVGKTFS